MNGRIARIGFLAVVAAAVTCPAPAQDEPAPSAEKEGHSRGQRAGNRGGRGQFTTATFEQMWERTQKPDLEAAGIASEKIEQLKQLEIETRAAVSRGERPDFKALNQKRREILTREEMQKLIEIRRQRREGDLRTTVTAELETTSTKTTGTAASE